ncbi:MAG: hypothetical protein IPJ88_09130 [Myxococcales bacterium]|nr:MAG: hypothetical protein IPJ88_09130 [Myxococcales bacterium]
MKDRQSLETQGLVDWAKDGSFDVEHFEALAATHVAPWKATQIASDAPKSDPADFPAQQARALAEVGFAETLLRKPDPDTEDQNTFTSSATASASKQSAAWQSQPMADDFPVELPEKKAPSKKTLMIGAGAAAIVLVALGTWALGGSDDNPEKQPEPSNAQASEKAPSTGAAASSTPAKKAPKPVSGTKVEKPAAPELLELQIQALPIEASVTMNGLEVSNPFKSEVESGSSLLFEAKATGYVTRSMTVTVDRPRSITLTLQKEAAPKAVKAPVKAKKPVRPRPRPKTPASGKIIKDNPY